MGLPKYTLIYPSTRLGETTNLSWAEGMEAARESQSRKPSILIEHLRMKPLSWAF